VDWPPPPVAASIIKGRPVHEEARKIKVLALDKTGTDHPGPTQRLVAFPPSIECGLLMISTRCHYRAHHTVFLFTNLPQSDAQSLEGERLNVEASRPYPGRGGAAIIAGRPLMLANQQTAGSRMLGLCLPANWKPSNARCTNRQGKIAQLLADETGVLALIAVADTRRPSSAAAHEGPCAKPGVTPGDAHGRQTQPQPRDRRRGRIEEVKATCYAGQAQAVADLQAPLRIPGHGAGCINDAPGSGPGDIASADGGPRATQQSPSESG